MSSQSGCCVFPGTQVACSFPPLFFRRSGPLLPTVLCYSRAFIHLQCSTNSLPDIRQVYQYPTLYFEIYFAMTTLLIDFINFIYGYCQKILSPHLPSVVGLGPTPTLTLILICVVYKIWFTQCYSEDFSNGIQRVYHLYTTLETHFYHDTTSYKFHQNLLMDVTGNPLAPLSICHESRPYPNPNPDTDLGGSPNRIHPLAFNKCIHWI